MLPQVVGQVRRQVQGHAEVLRGREESDALALLFDTLGDLRGDPRRLAEGVRRGVVDVDQAVVFRSGKVRASHAYLPGQHLVFHRQAATLFPFLDPLAGGEEDRSAVGDPPYLLYLPGGVLGDDTGKQKEQAFE